MVEDDVSSSSTQNDQIIFENLLDNDLIGDAINDNKEDHVLRLYFGNPNGLTLSPTGGDFKEYLEQMKQFDVDIVGLNEHNLDTQKHSVKQILYDSCRKVYDHSKLVFTSSTIPSKYNFKPGGTMLAAQGKITSRIVESGVDSYGRWCYVVLSGKDSKKITIITAYQVCPQNVVTKGRVRTLTATVQQTSMLRSKGRDCTPRAAFIADLILFVKDCQKKGHSILIGGDFNDALDHNTSTGMNKLVADCNLNDLMYSKLGFDNFATYQEGRERIDYILCSDWIAECVDSVCYEPFGYRTKGDHRNMIIDINSTLLFGNPTYNLCNPATRDIRSKDRSCNRLYIQNKFKYLQEHNFDERLQQLMITWDPDLAEKLDRDWIRASFSASRQCKKKPNIAFVRKLADLRIEKNVLLRAISEFRTGRCMSESIAHQAREGHSFLIPSSLSDCQKSCREVQRSIRQLEKEATLHRSEDLQHSLNIAIETKNKEEAKKLRIRIKAEQTKAMYQKLRQLRGSQKSGITKIDVPATGQLQDSHSCREWITIDTPKEIESKLRERNQGHFSQAHGTFPTIPPFSEWVDWNASTHTAELILQGNFDTTELQDLQAALLQYMKYKTQPDSLPDIISYDEWVGKIQSWDESTSTSPSGYHLGHSRALVSDHDLSPDSDEALELGKQREQLIHWQVKLINLAIINRYSYERWQTIVNVMILKEPGNYRINRLRVIHLYEHDFNLILGIKWRQMIRHSVDNHNINPSQFGGLPGKDAITPTIIEEFQYEISRASRRPLIHLDYDATSCYDRIIPSVASLLSRGHGVHRNICIVHASTLQHAKYLLKTQLGISEEFYQHSPLYPLYGTGQGSANSPAIWCIISSALFDVYEKHARGAYFQSPDGKHSLKVFMIGFVDDTSSSVNDFLESTIQSPSHYVALASKDAQLWNDLLQLSGGALESSKCSYHFLYFDFTVTGNPVMLPGQLDPRLQINFNDNNILSPLDARSAYTAHKTLGTHKAPAGTQRTAYRITSDKCLTHLKVIARSSLNHHHSWTYYHSVFLPSLSYPLVSGYLQPKQLHQLDRDTKAVFLPKLGYNRNTTTCVVFGSSYYGGIELRQFYVEQGASQIRMFIKCWRAPGIPGILLRIAMSWAQLLAGTQDPILTHTSAQLPHLDSLKWIPSLRNFLNSIKATIELDESFQPSLQREHDFFIMDYIMSRPSTKAFHIRILNACRLYLGVTLWSDLVQPDGTALDPCCFNGNTLFFNTHRGLIPHQANPSPTAWALWRRYLRPLLVGRSAQLRQPLARWICSGDKLHRRWFHLYSRATQCLYLWKFGNYEVYDRVRRRSFDYSGSVTSILPSDAIPTSVDLSTPLIQTTSSISLLRFPQPSPGSDFSSFIKTLQPWEETLLSQVSLTTDVFHLSDMVQTKSEIVIASDGSVSSDCASYGWVSSFIDGERFATGNGPSFGHRCSSYRAEGYGILSTLRFLLRLSEFTSTPLPTKLTVYSDSESMLQKISAYRAYPFYYPNTTLDAEWDIIQSIVSSLNEFRYPPDLVHIKGHQDQHTEYGRLELPAQLNVDADKLASQFNREVLYSTVPMIFGARAQLHISGHTITSNHATAIRQAATTQSIKEYIQRKANWSNEVFQMVDWTCHSRAIKQLYLKKKFLVKYIHNCLPTGKRLSYYASTYDHRCPTCKCDMEDRDHLLRCPSRRNWRLSLFTDIETYTTKISYDKSVATILVDALDCWLFDTDMNHHLPFYQPIINSQQQLGWDQLFLGRFSQEWSQFSPTDNNSIGQRWVTGVIKIIWEHVHLLWKERNSHKHGVDTITREIALLHQARRETTELYQTRTSVLPRDRQLFYETIEAHFQAEPTSAGLQQWLLTWKSVILASVEENKRLRIGNSRSIASYFRPLSNNTPPINNNSNTT